MMEQWGPGEKVKTEKVFTKVLVNNEYVDLVFGEYPHSRQDNNIYARFSENNIVGFSGHRVCWSINIEEYNYLKDSEYSGDDIREGCTTKIFANRIQIYEFFSRKYEQALHEAKTIIDNILNLPFAIWVDEDRELLLGRKIWYRSTPAVVTTILLDQGCLMLKPDNGLKEFPNPPYREQDQMEEQDEIKVEIIDHNIWWFRQ